MAQEVRYLLGMRHETFESVFVFAHLYSNYSTVAVRYEAHRVFARMTLLLMTTSVCTAFTIKYMTDINNWHD